MRMDSESRYDSSVTVVRHLAVPSSASIFQISHIRYTARPETTYIHYTAVLREKF